MTSLKYGDILNLKKKILIGEECMPESDSKQILIDKLLAIGGESVEVPENVNEDIIKFGHLLDYDVMIGPGGTSRLYMNRDEDDESIRVVSGFILMEDGIWRSHAWLMLNNCGYKIIDNIKADKYFGVVMPY